MLAAGVVAIAAIVAIVASQQTENSLNLGEVATEAFDGTDVFVSGDETSASVVILDSNYLEGTPALTGLLDELGFGGATIDRMGQTRALDGTLSAEGDGVDVTWTYHPDDGLQVVFEVTD